MKQVRLIIPCLLLVLFSSSIQADKKTASPVVKKKLWQVLSPGLEYAEFKAGKKADRGDSMIRILKIDPSYFTFHLKNAAAKGEGTSMSVRQWAKKYNFVAAINASMYLPVNLRSTAYMRAQNHVNNAKVHKRHKTFLAFHPKNKSVKDSIRLYDKECDNIDHLKKDYYAVVQMIRMISCKGKNVWQQRDKKNSSSIIAADKKGNILFIHVRSLYTTHDLIDQLLALPIEIRTAMYVEGGAQAQLFINSREKEYNLLGRYSSIFGRHLISKFGYPVPNVIGIKKRK